MTVVFSTETKIATLNAPSFPLPRLNITECDNLEQRNDDDDDDEDDSTVTAPPNIEKASRSSADTDNDNELRQF